MFFILEKLFFDFGPIFFGIAGFLLASYVYTKKSKQTPLVCPMNGSCDDVVNSRYSKFLGIPVEILGMIYYAFIVLLYAYVVINGDTVSDGFKFFATGVTVAAFLFSVYLVAIQAFILRKWCTWCLFSAGFSTFIFVTAVFGADFDLVALLARYKGIIVVFHALAAAIGVGSATVTDVLFFRFLKDYKISESEKSIMDSMSGIIWTALGILIITGIGLYIPNSETLLQSSKFLTKVAAVTVLVINGLLLNLVISPRLMDITFGEADNPLRHDLNFMRRLALALGAISITSWYVVFILGSLRSIPLPVGGGVAMYISLLIIAIGSSQLFGNLLIAKRNREVNGK